MDNRRHVGEVHMVTRSRGHGLHAASTGPKHERAGGIWAYRVGLVLLCLLIPLAAHSQGSRWDADVVDFDDGDDLQQKYDAGDLGGGALDCTTTPGTCVLENPATDALCIGEQTPGGACNTYLDSSGLISCNVPGACFSTTPPNSGVYGEWWDFEELGGGNRVRIHAPIFLANDIDIDLSTLAGGGGGDGNGFEYIGPLAPNYGAFPASGWWGAQLLYAPDTGNEIEVPANSIVDIEIRGAIEIRDTATVPGEFGIHVNPYTTDVGNTGNYQYAGAGVTQCTINATVAPSFVPFTCTLTAVQVGVSSVSPTDPVWVFVEVGGVGETNTKRLAGTNTQTQPGTHDGTGSTPGVNNVNQLGTMRVLVHR